MSCLKHSWDLSLSHHSLNPFTPVHPPPKNPQKKEKPDHWIKLHYFVLNNKTSQTVLSNQIEVSY